MRRHWRAFIPGLAVAETLHERGHEVLLFVSEKEIDTTALRDHPEFRAEKLPSVGMPSNILSPAFVGFIRRFWESYSQCKKIYRKFRPSVVLGMGGFTSTAPILAARMKGLPCFVHESNAIPGRANRLAAKFATSVLIGFEESRQRFPSANCINTGTPVRRNLGNPLERAEAMKAFGLDPSRQTLLVTGGSQGQVASTNFFLKAPRFSLAPGSRLSISLEKMTTALLPPITNGTTFPTTLRHFIIVWKRLIPPRIWLYREQALPV